MTGQLFVERPPRSIAIVMMTALGDAVHVLPVASALKRRWPDTPITWVVQPAAYSLMHGHPAIDEFIVFRRRRGVRAVESYRELRTAVRGRRWELLLGLQVYFKAGVVTGLVPADIKLGFDARRARDLNRLFTTHRIASRPNAHVQDQYFEFLEHLGVDPQPVEWNLGPWPDEEGVLSEFFAGIDRPVATLVIATSNPHKDWVPERWAEVCDALHERFGLRAVLAGGRSERELATERVIMEHTRHRPLSTLGLPLRELVALIDASALVISLDTGPMHMSVALDTPVIALMGYNDPQRVGPYRRFHDLIIDAFHDPGEHAPITPAHRSGRMERISVEDVLDKVQFWTERYR
jgi:heptosyltransferase I